MRAHDKHEVYDTHSQKLVEEGLKNPTAPDFWQEFAFQEKPQLRRSSSRIPKIRAPKDFWLIWVFWDLARPSKTNRMPCFPHKAPQDKFSAKRRPRRQTLCLQTVCFVFVKYWVQDAFHVRHCTVGLPDAAMVSFFRL